MAAEHDNADAHEDQRTSARAGDSHPTPGEPMLPKLQKLWTTVSHWRFWTVTFGLVIGPGLSVALGVLFYIYGGVPQDFDRYGVVGVPGTAVVGLPEGFVMLDHVDDEYGPDACATTRTTYLATGSIYRAPKGMAVRVVSVEGGEPLAVTSIPTWIYEKSANCRGHTPWGRIDVPKAGLYKVQTTDTASGGFGNAIDPKVPATGDTARGPGITFGQAPKAPFGSRFLAALLVIGVGLGTSLASGAVLKRVLPKMNTWLDGRRATLPTLERDLPA
ncbi:MAG: hypothetical protein ABIR57_00670 [Aeromicrobium sp.]